MPREPARQGASLRSPYGLPSLRTLAARIHPFRLLIPCPMSEGDGIEPGDGPFDHPPGGSQSAAMLSPPLGEDGPYSPEPEHPAVVLRVVGAVTLDGIWTAPRASGFAAHRRDGIQQGKKLSHVMPVGAGHRDREGDALGVREDVVLAARLAAVDGAGSGVFPPCMARTEELSTMARSQAIAPADWSLASNSAWIRSHRPRRCHSASRRQQLTPEPQRISSGSILQGIPVRRTNRMPVSACRFEIGIRPGKRNRREAGLGKSGSIKAHNSSSKIGLAIVRCPPPDTAQSPVIPRAILFETGSKYKTKSACWSHLIPGYFAEWRSNTTSRGRKVVSFCRFLPPGPKFHRALARIPLSHVAIRGFRGDRY